MKHFRKIIRAGVCLVLGLSVLAAGFLLPQTAEAAGTPTSLGFAEHGIRAYRDGWVYAYGGKGETNSDGKRQSDCSGLIYAYFSDTTLGSCQGNVSGQVKRNCVLTSAVTDWLPRIHGLTITMSSGGGYTHTGIYIGNNEVVDNSEPGVNMLRGPVIGSRRNWNEWHVFDNGMKYPSNGWYALDGKMVHYSSYEYDTDTTIDGYAIGSDGYALDSDGKAASVNKSMLSSRYVSATEVANYLKSKYSFTIPEGFNGKTNANVRLRKSPNTQSDIITLLNSGTYVKIQGEENGESITDDGQTTKVWYKVTTTGGLSGYVCSLYVDRIEQEPAPAPQPQPKPQKPAAPVITAKDGYVTITCATSGADIYYTMDLTEPSVHTTPYTGPVYRVGVTYKAVAVKEGQKSSITTASVLSNSSVFRDVYSNRWYFRYVDQATALGIFRGNGDGTFAPNQPITRGQFVTALAYLDGVDLDQYADLENSGFTDVKVGKSKVAQSIVWAVQNNVVQGYPNGRFLPNEPISREQMCTIMARYAKLEPVSDPSRFGDDGRISSWAADAVYSCRDAGLIQGTGDNMFDPSGTATRCQACVITVNLHDLTR